MQALLKQMPQLQGPTPLSYTDIPFPRRHPGGGMSLSRTSLAARHPQGLHTTFKVSQSEMTMRLQTYIHQIDRYLRIAGNASQQVGQSTRPNATAILTTVAGPSDSFSLNSSLFNADVIPGRATTSSGPSASGRRVPIPEDHRLMRLHKLSHENYRAITNSIAS
ncbi:hypothetical protein BJ085DRAFT_34839 [Dimargaris cristalligena]|uniref:Uncharacterized protein n=1 Tax=Dimargaris cristalligena TaxID=215637 RepID=A0A4P9ZNJ7_9FUNG|nr:hypothetical protein BJ085DRAFT_34839 [Dimargaris cristalligena]|eukprot:RKP34863.1 hypothetical protein BJ085DRAFT_34839 [Dimargaris cristalligena]